MTPKSPKRITRASSKPRRTVAVPTPASDYFTKYVGTLQVKPRRQSRMSLGLYDTANQPKGFCVVLEPDPEEGTVTAEVSTPLGRMETYELTLQITNYGTADIRAEVWQM